MNRDFNNQKDEEKEKKSKGGFRKGRGKPKGKLSVVQYYDRDGSILTEYFSAPFQRIDFEIWLERNGYQIK